MLVLTKKNRNSCSKMIINRFHQNEFETLGIGICLNDDYQIIYTFYTLELPDKNNKKYVSRIPEGTYYTIKHWHPRLKETFYINHVANRNGILIHRGNYYKDIKGCILVGQSFIDLNNDKIKDVFQSSKTIDDLTFLMQSNFTLIIK